MAQQDPSRVPNAFSKLMAGSDPVAARAAETARSFEHETVKWLLLRFGLKRMIPQFCREAQELGLGYTLRCSTFNAHYNTFPFVIGCHTLKRLPVPWPSTSRVGGPVFTPDEYQVHLDGYSTEPARFKKFAWVPFVVAFARHYDEVRPRLAGRRAALVYPRRGFMRGMVIHDDDSEQYWRDGLCWVYKSPRTERRLYVQPFGNLFEAVYAHGKGWRPPGEA